MYNTSLCYLTATELALKIRSGEISAVETMEAHLAQIEKVNPQVNAIVTLVPELALEQARKADEKLAQGGKLGPLHGLPVAHKDLVPTKGIRTTFGSPIFQDFVPEQDALLVERIRHMPGGFRLEKPIHRNLAPARRPLTRFLEQQKTPTI